MSVANAGAESAVVEEPIHSSHTLLRAKLAHCINFTEMLDVWSVLSDQDVDCRIRLITTVANLAHGRLGDHSLADVAAAMQWQRGLGPQVEGGLAFNDITYLLKLEEFNENNMAWLTVQCFARRQSQAFGEIRTRVFRAKDGKVGFDMRALHFKPSVIEPVRFDPTRTIFHEVAHFAAANVTLAWCVKIMQDICVYAGDGEGYYYKAFLDYCGEILKRYPQAIFEAKIDVTGGVVDLQVTMKHYERGDVSGTTLAKFEQTLIRKN